MIGKERERKIHTEQCLVALTDLVIRKGLLLAMLRDHMVSGIVLRTYTLAH